MAENEPDTWGYFTLALHFGIFFCGDFGIPNDSTENPHHSEVIWAGPSSTLANGKELEYCDVTGGYFP